MNVTSTLPVTALPERRAHTVFVSYNGLLEPLGQTQVVPYVRGLAGRYRITVLSFEKSNDLADRSRIAGLQEDLLACGIAWRCARYHKSPSLPATAYDVLAGALALSRIHVRRRIDLMHARGYVAAAMTMLARHVTRAPYIFDIRGLQAEEYVDGGLWQPESFPVRVTRRVERNLLRHAAGIVTLTESIRPHVLSSPGLVGRRVPPSAVIPCCVDLDRFAFAADHDRADVRRKLGLATRPVLVYSGSIGTWYLLDKMVAYFRAAQAHIPELAFLILANNGHEIVERAFADAGIRPDDYRVLRVAAADVPLHLAAADIGIAFIRPSFSKLASSPTKIAEYLACGLPVVVNAGVGDTNALGQSAAVQLVADLSEEGINCYARDAVALLKVSRHVARHEATARFSLEQFALPRYRRLYDEILADTCRSSS